MIPYIEEEEEDEEEEIRYEDHDKLMQYGYMHGIARLLIVSVSYFNYYVFNENDKKDYQH